MWKNQKDLQLKAPRNVFKCYTQTHSIHYIYSMMSQQDTEGFVPYRGKREHLKKQAYVNLIKTCRKISSSTYTHSLHRGKHTENHVPPSLPMSQDPLNSHHVTAAKSQLLSSARAAECTHFCNHIIHSSRGDERGDRGSQQDRGEEMEMRERGGRKMTATWQNKGWMSQRKRGSSYQGEISRGDEGIFQSLGFWRKDRRRAKWDGWRGRKKDQC